MRSEFMGEEPSLTVLFGDEVDQDIQAVAAEMGLPVSSVRAAVQTFAPELLGEDTASDPKFGDKFSNVFKGIAEGISTAAPSIAAAIKGQPATAPATTDQTGINFQSLLIPAGIAAVLLFLIMKK